jgi:hypothetical protein
MLENEKEEEEEEKKVVDGFIIKDDSILGLT